MSFDPFLRDLLAQGRKAAEDLRGFDWRGPALEARKRFWRFAHDFEADAPLMLERRGLMAEGAAGPLPARLYVPFAAGVVSPLLVYLHGGGFISGDLDTHEIICRRLADAGRMRVLSVAYRLAPEHKWPAAPEDAIAATRWALAHAGDLGADRIGVGGDSAGGNLATVACLATREDARRPTAQLLIYPCTQLVRMAPLQAPAQSHGMMQAVQDWVCEAYLPDREAAYDWRASPLLAKDFRGLPPALVVTAGLDPLRDEGAAYAATLAASGVVTAHKDYPGQVHGFFNMTAISPAAKAAIADCGRWAAETLAA